MIRPLQVYWNPRQSRFAVVGESDEAGAVNVLLFKLNDVARSMMYRTWKRGVPHGWTLWKDVRP